MSELKARQVGQRPLRDLFWDVLFEDTNGAPIDNSEYAVTAAVFKNAGRSELEHSLWRTRVLPAILRESVRKDREYRHQVGMSQYTRYIDANHEEAGNTDWTEFIPAGPNRAEHERGLAEWFVAHQSRHKLELDSEIVGEESRKVYDFDFIAACRSTAEEQLEAKVSRRTRGELIDLEELVKIRQGEEPDQNGRTVRNSLMKQLSRRRFHIERNPDILPCLVYENGRYLENIYIITAGGKGDVNSWRFELRDPSKD
jgi:hypothetical protein